VTVNDFELPLEPLERFLGPHFCEQVGTGGRGMSSREWPYHRQDFADLAGCSDRTVVRWRTSGRIPLRWADRIAVKLGVHPLAIWGEHYVEWLAA
jgi:hypothetical protein